MDTFFPLQVLRERSEIYLAAAAAAATATDGDNVRYERCSINSHPRQDSTQYSTKKPLEYFL